MTKLHFNYKDVFRALRLGFSAKKVWMSSLGLMFAFVGYGVLTYVAFIAAGVDFLAVWQQFRLLPFPSLVDYPFPWFSWLIYAAAVAWFLCAFLVTGTAVSRVAHEQLRGDEFYESREAFKFAFKNAAAVLASPLLILAFVALLAVGGLVFSALGAIPSAGEIVVALLSPIAFVASLFIVYLLIVFIFSVLMGPSVVGSSRSDTFDTLFEVFSCVNEQPARLLWYTAVVAALAKVGTVLMGVAAGLAARIGTSICGLFMGDKLADAMTNAGFYFKVSMPEWCPGTCHQTMVSVLNAVGLSSAYLPGDYLSLGWSTDVAALLLGVCLYLVVLMVLGFGCSVWFSGMTLNFTVLAFKKDDKNLLEMPEDIEELTEPVPNPETDHLKPEPAPPAEEKK
jgi:hypothetical protein